MNLENVQCSRELFNVLSLFRFQLISSSCIKKNVRVHKNIKIMIYNSRKGIINCGKCLDPVLHVP